MDVIRLSKLLIELAGDMSAEELADRVGIPGQSMRNYMYRPKSRPGIDVLVKIAEYMGISLDELAERIGAKNSSKPKPVYMVYTVDDALKVTQGLNQRGRIDLCARLLSDASATYGA